jgi:hypothetical protein
LFWGFAGSKLRKILAGRRFCWKRLRASKKARSSWFIYQIFMIEEKWIRTLEAAFSHMVAIYFLQFWYDS